MHIVGIFSNVKSSTCDEFQVFPEKATNGRIGHEFSGMISPLFLR